MTDPAAVAAANGDTVVFTDGACLGNPGPGGWAWAVPDGPFAAGFDPATTNQRMELLAVLRAVERFEGRLHVVSDSTYVVNCFRDRWYEGWLRRGWKNSSRQPVANRDLWEPLIERYLARPDEITFEWVKGHSGDRWNDVVDRLATDAARRQEARSGDHPPTWLGDADAPGVTDTLGDPGRTAAPPLTGWKVAAMGHRPPELGGWDPASPVAAAVRRRIEEIVDAWAQVHHDIVVLTGMGLGAEQLAAEACAAAGIPYVAVLAHPDPDKVWPAASRARFAALVADAVQVVTLDPAPPASKVEAGRAMGRRDAWLAAQADAAIVVWDGADGHLGRTVADLERRDVDLFVVSPDG